MGNNNQNGMEHIKQIIKAGFRVYLLDLNEAEAPKPKPQAEPKHIGRPKKYLASPKPIKRVGRSVLAKIQTLKNDGWSVEEAAEDLGLEMEQVEKNWG